MSPAAIVDAIRLFVALVAVSAAAAVAVRRLAIPYSVLLVVLGLLAALFAPRGELAVSPEVVLLVLVPGLVFEAALGMDLGELTRRSGGIALLAIPGVLLSAAVVALVLFAMAGLDPKLGFVVGAMVAATDPVAVVATFRRLGVPLGLSTLVEGESLFNDGTALVVFVVAVRAVQGDVSALDATVSIAATVVVSIAIGLLAGYLASRVMAGLDDHVIELSISLTAAYGTYLVADALHESGIIATVVAGVVLGNYGRAKGMSRRTEEALDTVWEFLAFLLTALAFLLVGLAIPLEGIIRTFPWIVWGIAGIVIGRVLVVYALLGGSSRLLERIRVARGRKRARRPLPVAWLHVMFWAGLRGAVAVAMALSLPTDFPERLLLQEIVFGIVLFTLFVQGTSAERVVGRALRREPRRHEPAQASELVP
jgi:CPA1 family monovalent cation:H+ antiporter